MSNTNTKNFVVRLPRDIDAVLRDIAKAENRSGNAQIIQLIKDEEKRRARRVQ